MTRFLAAAAISICSFFIAVPAHAQSDQDSSDKCFPWQDFRDGTCVSKATPSPAPPPLPARCIGGTNDASGQCVCPPNTHLDAGSCLANAGPTRRPGDNIVCDGGTPNGGTCICPTGFDLTPAGENAAGGRCVKTHAENCLGGELTVAGKCLCNGQVVMSGETYALEFVNGKCVPKRCPVNNEKCVATSAKPGTPEVEEKSRPGPRESSDEPERRHCAHGMIRTRAGCVVARRRHPGIYENGPGAFGREYFRIYDYPRYSTPSQN